MNSDRNDLIWCILFSKVLIALQFIAKSAHLSELANIHGVSTSTVSRCIEKVACYIADEESNKICCDNEP